MSDIVAPTDWKPGDAVISYYSDYVGIVVEILHQDENSQDLALVYWPDKETIPINFTILQSAF